MRLSIRPTRAVLLLAAFAVAIIVAACSFLLWDLRERELEHARGETLSLARMFLEQTEQNFEGADLVVRGIQERLQTEFGRLLALDSEPIHLLLAARLAGMRQLNSLFLVDDAGFVVNSSREQSPARMSVADRDYFRRLGQSTQAELVIDKPVRSRVDGGWTLHLARRLESADGRFRGIVVAGVSIARFERLYSFIRLDYQRPMAIYLADGTLVAGVPHRENLIGDRAPELGAAALPVAGENVRMVTHISGDGGRRVFALGRTVKFPLLVSVTTDEEQALASWRETSVPIAIGAALTCLFIGAVALLLVRELRREEVLSRELTEANDRYYHTIDSVLDAIVAVDGSQNVLLFNPAAERMFGYAARDVIGQPLARLLPERMRAVHGGHLKGFAQGDSVSRAMAANLAVAGQRADGTEFPIESTISRTLLGGKLQLTAVLRDVTERRRAEAAVLDMNRQLRDLSASLQSVREQERTRISRELHDDLGQQLTGLKLELSWLAGRLRDGRGAPPDKLDAMRRALDAAIVSVRRISTDLRPPILDDLGFGEAVAWHAGEFGQRTKLAISLDLAAAPLVTCEAQATALFRIVQESLTNVARHAAATGVRIALVAQDEELVLTVCDDGRGLAGGPQRPGGVGLVGMRERATALGGHFRVYDRPEGGVCVEVRLPLQWADAPGDEA
jgi:PAS domain S-box-containing protein